MAHQEESGGGGGRGHHSQKIIKIKIKSREQRREGGCGGTGCFTGEAKRETEDAPEAK